MPNWKKVITSGSNAELNQITASGAQIQNIKAQQLQDTTLTSGRVTFATTDGVLTDSNILTFDGSKLSSTFLEAQRSSVINESGHSTGNFRVEGGGNTHLLFTDASEDTVGIKNSSPSASLDITGDLRTSSHITASGNISSSGTIHGDQIVGGSTVYDTAGNIVAYGASRTSIIIQTSNNNNDAGIAFRNSGGSYSNNIYRTNIGDSDADLRIAGGDTQGTISNLDDYVAIKGGTGATAGFVGIGNNEPSKKLTVNGDISASGDFIGKSTSTGSFGSVETSGNISASGTITMLTASIGGGIFTSASLAAGGGGGGSFNNFTLTADGGSDQTIEDGNTLDIAGGTNITTAVGATDTVTINLDASPSVTNITASGNISASGATFHSVLKLTGGSADLDLDSQAAVLYDNTANLSAISRDSNTLKVGGGGSWTDVQIGRAASQPKSIQIYGPITASHPISASGKSIFENLNVFSPASTIKMGENVAGNFDGIAVQGVITSSGNLIIQGDINAGDITDVTNITASGDISASGDILATDILLRHDAVGVGNPSLQLRNDTNNIGAQQSILFSSGSPTTSAGNNTAQINFTPNASAKSLSIINYIADGTVSLGVNASTKLRVKSTGIDLFEPIDTDITASGNISGSATSTISVGGNITTLGTLSAEQITSTDDMTVTDDLTVGGNISASGNVQVNQITASAFQFVGSGDAELVVQGNITASGNISASGAITATDPTLTYASASIAGLANGQGYGEIIDLFPAHPSTAVGDVVFHLGSAGTVWRTGANSSAYSVNMAGVALEAGDGSTPCRVLTKGVVRLAADHIEDTSGTNGQPLYSGDTAGHVQFAAPSDSGDLVRILGYCLVEDDDIIYFNPDNTFIEIA